MLMFDNVITSTTTNPLRTVDWRKKVLVLFGTRPEAIKLAPVITELRKRFFQTIVVSSSQHKQMLLPFLETLSIDVDFDLGVMQAKSITERCLFACDRKARQDTRTGTAGSHTRTGRYDNDAGRGACRI